jgi:hypothetical protein
MQLSVTETQGKPTSLWAFGAGGKFTANCPFRFIMEKNVHKTITLTQTEIK